MVFGGAKLAYGVFAADHDQTFWWVTMSGYGCVFPFGAVHPVWHGGGCTAQTFRGQV